MSDKDQKVVNTEEETRAVNPSDTPNQEQSVVNDAPEKSNEKADKKGE